MSFIGRVKWFNNKAGYGFITVTDGEKSGQDIFVHDSGISVDSEQFKYLLQGEYVEFQISPTAEGSKHPSQATSVTGVKGGKLMCQTRNENRKANSSTKEAAKSVTDSSTNPAPAPTFEKPKGRRAKKEKVTPSYKDSVKGKGKKEAK